MIDVVTAGVGQAPVGEHWDISLRELALQAIEAARADAAGLQPQALIAANMLAPAGSGQAPRGALIADFAGLAGIGASATEASGAGGGAARRQAVCPLSAGAADVVLV